MKVTACAGEQADITLSLDEMIVLSNALNEVCNALEVFDFATRIGMERAQAAALLASLGACIDAIQSRPPEP